MSILKLLKYSINLLKLTILCEQIITTANNVYIGYPHLVQTESLKVLAHLFALEGRCEEALDGPPHEKLEGCLRN